MWASSAGASPKEGHTILPLAISGQGNLANLWVQTVGASYQRPVSYKFFTVTNILYKLAYPGLEDPHKNTGRFFLNARVIYLGASTILTVGTSVITDILYSFLTYSYITLYESMQRCQPKLSFLSYFQYICLLFGDQNASHLCLCPTVHYPIQCGIIYTSFCISFTTHSEAFILSERLW